MEKFRQQFISSFLCILTVLLVFYYKNKDSVFSVLQQSDATKNAEIMRTVYLDISQYSLKKTSEKDLLYQVLNSMLEGLDDDYATLYPPRESKVNDTVTMNKLIGIGIRYDIDKNSGEPLVLTPMDNSPALASGVLAGDFIYKIEDEVTKGMSPDDIPRKIKGEEGSIVHLTLRRLDNGKETFHEVKIKRQLVKQVNVIGFNRKNTAWQYYLENHPGIGYCRILNYHSGVAEELKARLEKIHSRVGLKGIVLDLRDDPGGLLREALAMASLFLEKDTVVFRERNRIKSGGSDWNDLGNGLFERSILNKKEGPFASFEIPLIILINGGTASAAELFSGSLRDNKKAKLIGTASYGKAYIQTVRPLTLPGEDGTYKLGSLKLTTGEWLPPLSIKLEKGKGLAPDIKVEVKDKKILIGIYKHWRLVSVIAPAKEVGIKTPKDPVLERAVKELQGK